MIIQNSKLFELPEELQLQGVQQLAEQPAQVVDAGQTVVNRGEMSKREADCHRAAMLAPLARTCHDMLERVHTWLEVNPEVSWAASESMIVDISDKLLENLDDFTQTLQTALARKAHLAFEWSMFTGDVHNRPRVAKKQQQLPVIFSVIHALILDPNSKLQSLQLSFDRRLMPLVQPLIDDLRSMNRVRPANQQIMLRLKLTWDNFGCYDRLPPLEQYPELVELSLMVMPVFPDVSKNPLLESIKVISSHDMPAFTDLSNNRMSRSIIILFSNNLPPMFDLSQVPSLEIFSLRGCNVTSAPDFSGNPELKEVDLSSTDITAAPVLEKNRKMIKLFMENCKHLALVHPVWDLPELECISITGENSLDADQLAVLKAAFEKRPLLLNV